ncbi:MAG: EAL domain-containing protein [Treponema sp.]|nr:EAL domain-containing protein [Treponema sp.]
MHYIVEYEIAAIILSLAVLFSFFRKKLVNTRLTRVFFALVMNVLLTAFIDLCVIHLHERILAKHIWLDYICNEIYYILITSFSLIFYDCIRTTLTGSVNRTKFQIVRYGGPISIGVISILSTPWTKMIFYFDEEMNFVKGWGYQVMYIVAAIYFLSAVYKVIILRKEATRAQRLTVYFYITMCVTSVVIQTINPKLIITGFVASIATMMVFLVLVNPTNYFDKETDILNLPAFRDVFAQYQFKKKPFRIIGIQIIGIRNLVETIGLENKTEIIRQFVIKLKSVCGRYSLYRVSSSRIYIFIPDDNKIENTLVKSINSVFDDSILMGDFRISLSEHIAVYKYPDDSDTLADVEDLIRSTLSSIYNEKPHTAVHVEKSVLAKKSRELQILQVMKKAVRRGDFYVVYQPIYSFEQNRFTTAEALVRLENDELGEVSPEEFIPIAEQNGMILQIGEFVFETVCRFVLHHKIWEKGIEYIHVNLSVIQCMQEKLADQLFRIMDLYNLDYRYINLEVTESAAIASSEVLMDNMNRLIERNMNFSLDDFGTGFSNTATLIKYPFHTIKLDKGMVWDAMHNKKAEIILKNTIEMVKMLNMEIVAEGAETPEQVEKLREMGVDFVQGFYYSKPISRDDFLKLLNDGKERRKEYD